MKFLKMSAFFLLVVLASCSSDDETTPPLTPVTWQEFSQRLPIEVCKGIYNGDYVHPWQVRLSRFPDENTCVEQLSAVQLDSRWPDYEAAIAAGDLEYDSQKAASCLESVSTDIGNGYLYWQNAGDCALAIRGSGGACVSDLWCNVGDVCSESACTPARIGFCEDSHRCRADEWCYGFQCQPRKGRMTSDEKCTAWTDNESQQDIRCNPGQTCDITHLDSALGLYEANGVCAPPQPVGAYCVWDYDCDFQSYCDVASCSTPPCASECRPRLAAGASCGDYQCASNRCINYVCE